MYSLGKVEFMSPYSASSMAQKRSFDEVAVSVVEGSKSRLGQRSSTDSEKLISLNISGTVMIEPQLPYPICRL
jgi:hypothetical protein